MSTPKSPLVITSPDFVHGGALPEAAGAAFDNQAPVLDISGVPDGTVELAMILHDPDSARPEGFTHWLVYSLSPDTTRIDASTLGRARQGENDAGTTKYFGPQPRSGHGLHHYYFVVYALNTKVDGIPSRREFLNRYAPHILEQNRIVGTFITP